MAEIGRITQYVLEPGMSDLPAWVRTLSCLVKLMKIGME